MRCIRRKRLRAHRYRGHAAPGRKCQARYIASTTMTINTATTHAIRKATPPSAKNGVDAVRPAATSCSSLRASGLSAAGTAMGSLALSSGRFITEVRYPVHTRQNPPRAPRVSGRLQRSSRDRNPRERIVVLRQLPAAKRTASGIFARPESAQADSGLAPTISRKEGRTARATRRRSPLDETPARGPSAESRLPRARPSRRRRRYRWRRSVSIDASRDERSLERPHAALGV